jgi:formamidopyrimidine-DNA glycosylase
MEVARVYQKEKDPKGHPIKRVTLGGRGTFYCEICQH